MSQNFCNIGHIKNFEDPKAVRDGRYKLFTLVFNKEERERWEKDYTKKQTLEMRSGDEVDQDPAIYPGEVPEYDQMGQSGWAKDMEEALNKPSTGVGPGEWEDEAAHRTKPKASSS